MGDTIWKLLLLIVFGPAICLVAFQFLAALLVAILPVLIVLAVIAGAVAGVSAGFLIRRRLPPRNAGNALAPGLPPLGQYRRRRPRGGRDWR
jgi:hypothetical protein